MISMEEILMDRAEFNSLPIDIQANLITLHSRINVIRKAYAKPMYVNSGLRRLQDQPANAASKSKHLIGAAIDLRDDDNGTLWKWCLKNLDLMAKVGLWLEDPRWTHGAGNWMHFQIIPPGSGKRVFVPSSAKPSAPDLWDGNYDRSLDSKNQPI